MEEVLAVADDGWILDSVVPMIGPVVGSPGGTETVGSKYAPYTNEQLWIFKRPKV